MEFKQTLQNRHSVRMFTNQVVDRDTIREIIHEAQLAPSWVNSQPYHVYLVVGEALERVRAIGPITVPRSTMHYWRLKFLLLSTGQ